MDEAFGHTLRRDRAVERLIFGTADETEILSVLRRFCSKVLGSVPRETLFVRTSVGVVFGLELESSQRVVVKAHQPRQSAAFLRCVFETQRQLATAGFPCPRPVAPPAPIGSGFATVEEWVENGAFADARSPVVRDAMAQALAHLLELTRPLGRPAGLRDAWSLWEGDGVWPPTAHSPIFDFAATAPGAGWIDELAREAKAGIAGGEELIVHTDWGSKHFRFDDEARITAVYDWDSLALETEVQALGTAAATFTANVERDAFLAPSPDEVTGFISAYSSFRPTPLTERETLEAHAVASYLVTYTARCEHALGRRGDFGEALERFGRAYLAPASARA